ncbi:MAG: BolA family transcriptional regulator [Wenzhouxiangella sp.]|nr:BolA family transcriptional regulator [Wenzhouxiangella sp.]TVR98689.1 MAG: BolA family transcriptional regulator [Wenzhouxiangellaceae bacterium]
MSEHRVAMIRKRLTERLAPIELEVVDESHLHAGHPGARDGRGHFRLRIVSEVFHGLPRLARHRRIYAAMGELMQTDIHALSIEAFSPHEVE